MLRLLRFSQCMGQCASSNSNFLLHSTAHLAARSRTGPCSKSATLTSSSRRSPVLLAPNPETPFQRRSTLTYAKRGRRRSAETPTSMSREPKTCSTCGREITWRKKWERCWDDIKYCSDACRKNKPGDEAMCVTKCHCYRKAASMQYVGDTCDFLSPSLSEI